MSISYLFKIKIDDKYLLIKGTRIDQYQPVGGVYKKSPESFSFFNSIYALDDKHMPIDDVSRDDLRIRVKGKYMLKVLHWFDKKIEREITYQREFIEELIKTGILNYEPFMYINCRFLRRVETGIRYTPYFKCDEYLVADIYELITNQEQESALRRLMQEDSDQYIWVDEDKILSRGVTKEHLKADISESSSWIL
jgi:hypothetical protein